MLYDFLQKSSKTAKIIERLEAKQSPVIHTSAERKTLIRESCELLPEPDRKKRKQLAKLLVEIFPDDFENRQEKLF